jgi:predicted flap endonuclease-1-like 5' DNA nuclease
VSYPIISIEGVGPELAQKLKKAGVRTTKTLLERAKDPRGRKALAAASDIAESRILRFANIADLLRLKGVGAEYSELLEAAGVDTVKGLKNRNVANLTRAIMEVNAKRQLVRSPPSEKTVAKWIAEAKTLPPMMTY